MFLSKQFAVLLLLCHLLLLWVFADRSWFVEEGGVWNAVRGFFLHINGKDANGRGAGGKAPGPKAQRTGLTNERIVSIVFASNFVGILCARSLHYQFYSWYFHTIPFMLVSSGVSPMFMIPLFATVEWCWNAFPSTVFSSGLLLASHLFMMGMALRQGANATMPKTS